MNKSLFQVITDAICHTSSPSSVIFSKTWRELKFTGKARNIFSVH